MIVPTGAVAHLLPAAGLHPGRGVVAAGGPPALLLHHVHDLARLPHRALLGQRRQHVLVLS